MNSFPDFSTYGYQIEKELGHNSLGGRVTYLATNTKTQELVAIKQFQFAQLGATWAEYSAYEQEIQVLTKLSHPGIPRYLDDFPTDSGFCMVQEYINAESAIDRTFSPPDIKKIAIATLKILAYLQSQSSPVIHRDIKPENLLIDDNLNVYLVDFGFARIGGGNIAASSVVKGTMGFMPPEQMFNRELTKASDLYGLGITLICLLTGTKSGDVGNLIDANYSIHFRHLVPPLQQGWMNWLERMVAPRIQDRYQSAAEALAALESLDVSNLPKVRIDRDRLKFKATEYGEIITQTIAISNPIPDTMLAARWEVVPHRNDPPHTPYDHSWISFEPQTFESNSIECKIAIDTSKLLASKTYKRQIILRANSEPETKTIELKVTTSALPVPQITNSFSVGMLTFMCCFILAGFMIHSNAIANCFSNYYLTSMGILTTVFYGFAVAELAIAAKLKAVNFNWFGALCAGVIGLILSLVLTFFLAQMNFYISPNPTKIGQFAAIGFILISFFPIALTLFSLLIGSRLSRLKSGFVIFIGELLLFSLCVAFGKMGGDMLVALLILIFGSLAIVILILGSVIAYATVYFLFNRLIKEQAIGKVRKLDTGKIAFLTAGFCTSLGVALQLFFKWGNQLEWVEPMETIAVGGMTMVSLAATGIPLIDLIVFKPKRILANYRKSQANLIKP